MFREELGDSQGDSIPVQKSAEGIVVHAVGEAIEALRAERRSERIGRTGNGG